MAEGVLLLDGMCRPERAPLQIPDGFRHHGHGVAMRAVRALDGTDKGVNVQGALRYTDDMGRIGATPLAEHGCRGKPAGIASHHFDDLDRVRRTHGLGVQTGILRGLRDEARGAPESRAMVGARQVVVDRLRHQHYTEIGAGGTGGVMHAQRRIG
jgi:hypothetical protein